jgi:hypothetical protein
MHTSTFYGSWDYWDLQSKITIDYGLRHIIVDSNVTTLDIKEDVYGEIKRIFSLRDNKKYLFPIRTIGGDPTSDVEFAGDMYFMINNYRLVYDPTKVKVSGIIYSDDFDTPWLDSKTLDPVYPVTVSNLALARQADLSDLNIPTATENADAVWDKTTDDALINTYGARMLKLITVAKYLGLK